MAHRGSKAGVTLHRFFLPADILLSGHVNFPPEQSRQIRSVLRLRRGDRVIVLDGAGTELVVRLEDLNGEVSGTIVERARNDAEPSVVVTLYQGLLKGAKLELVLQKCTEIGVARFVPTIMERSVPAEPGPSRQRRYDAIVREAAEQSRRGCLPSVAPALPYAEALREAASRGPIVLLWEDEQSKHLRDTLTAPSSLSISLFVGPEGGLSEHEVMQARDVGAQIVTLGPRVLRAETAAIAGSALLLAHLGSFG